MTDLCHRLDPYLAGDLSDAEAERFEHHALTCPVCEAELALPADVADALTSLAEESCPPRVLAAAQSAADDEWPPVWSRELRAWSATPCPPDVLAAALKQTRRAGDREPAPRRRRHAWAWALAALIAVGGSWAALRPAPSESDQVAGLTPTSPPATGVPDASYAPPPPAPPQPSPVPGAVDPSPLGAGSQPSTASPRSPGTRPAVSAPLAPDLEPTPGGSDAAPPDLVATAPLAPGIAEREPSAQEIEDARRDLALAFALIDDAQSAAGAQVREQARTLGSTFNTSPF